MVTEHEWLTPPEPKYPYTCDVCHEGVYEVKEIGGDISRHGTFVCEDCLTEYLDSRAGECADDYIMDHEKEFYLDWWWNDGIDKADKVYYLKRLYDLIEDEKENLKVEFCLEQDDFYEFEMENLI